MEKDELESNIDSIKGRRLTNAESMYLLFPDLPLIDDGILEEILNKMISEEFQKSVSDMTFNISLSDDDKMKIINKLK